jgi:iron complex transport system substrate-binding protein
MRKLLSKACLPFKLPPSQLVSVKRLAEFLGPDTPAPTSSEQGLVRILCCSILYDTVVTLSGPPIPVRPQLMEEAIKYLEEHYAERVRVTDLVRHIGYGRARLFELFKRQTGLSPNDYLLRFRIRKAQDLLVQTNLSVREIARRIGVPDSGYFSLMFRRQTGHTPTVYRKRSVKA